ncbi:4-coumarate--CoA ligase-like 9 isoform X1 [Durio zibethinus]|uniref:4-coumarate--CoA ligase-like 9 isoform X1 n=1 Tax=Durio zibethinus TaxID=66656 RepID=A0A6P5XNY1_DURZI|nr:4-coumarate--CoA ligase-like 9 isoform X1 [Durio zibethinus]
MAEAAANHHRSIDPKTGFCPQTRTFHSLRPHVPLPPPSLSLSLPQYALSLLRTSSSSADSDGDTDFIIDATIGHRLSYSQFIAQIRSLAHSVRKNYSLSQNDVAFILSPPSLHVPLLYFALMSLGIVVSPANPLGSESEIAHQVQLSKPVIAFATSKTSSKIPSLKFGTVLLDSSEFLSFLTQSDVDNDVLNRAQVSQHDAAAILYSSGTTGRVKGVILSHLNLIALIAGYYHLRQLYREEEAPHPVPFFTVPLFHVFGFFMLARAFAMGETVVFTKRFEFEGMLRAIEKYKITYMPVSPPLVLAFIKSDLTNKYDLSSLLLLGSGGAPLGKEVAERFKEKFPTVELVQGYGLTETTGGATRVIGPEEAARYGTVGRLSENMEAKIVDPVTGEALPPGQRGELWLRGPIVMKGYVGDEKATAETLDSEGWLKTGDICYFDSEGFVYIVDRLKELIKYKAYQVPPAELEHLLHSHPEIADAAVIPYPDEEAGQIPMAYVVRNPGSSITEAQVMDFIARQVAPYKKIRRVAFINSIPKSPAGKILRRELVNHSVSGGLSKL